MKSSFKPVLPKHEMTKKEFGIWGEQVAVQLLIQEGMKIIGKNVRNQSGEIDIIGRKNGVVIFFEIKTRV